ncbi:MAG: ribosome small subunit-dependent GTPase A [Mycobacteriales bacterium]
MREPGRDEQLRLLGWDDEWDRAAAAHPAGPAPARVVRADPRRPLLATASRDVRGTATTPLVTGDWVLLHGDLVASRLPRRTELARGAAGRAAARQVLAANVDVVLVLVSLAAAPSAARLDRLLAVAWDSGAQPVVVLTKADLSRTADTERDEVAEAALAAPVLLTSTVDGRGLDELRGHLRPGRTAVLLGVSGAGKSSLLNALAGTGVARVGALGAGGKGRHITTARELRVLPGLGAVVDTPGLRGVRLWETGGGVDRAFADVVELAAHCRFRDCRHAGEPGCAVAAAVEAGELPARRVARHARLEREAAWLRDRYDARLRAEQRRRWKELARAVRSGQRADRRRRSRPG